MSFTSLKRIRESCHNLARAPEHTERVAELQAKILGWLEGTGHPYHAVVKAAAATPPQQSYRLQPTITDFTYLGGNRFQYTCQWRVEDPPPKDGRYWAFTHFCNEQYGKDGSIAFRDTTWPDPPTQDWKAGESYTLGPIEIAVPEHAGSGRYEILTGLYDPKYKRGPNIAGALTNRTPIGALQIQRTDGQVSNIELLKINNPPQPQRTKAIPPWERRRPRRLIFPLPTGTSAFPGERIPKVMQVLLYIEGGHSGGPMRYPTPWHRTPPHPIPPLF